MQIRKDTQLRQKEIIDAARKLIVKYGSENITVKKIAKEIGVTDGALYRHFKSKREILSFLADDIENTLISDIDSQNTGDINSIETLEKILLAHISAIEQRKGVTFQVIAEIVSLGDKKLNKKVSGTIIKYTERIQAILNNGKEKGIIKPDLDTDAAAALFFSMIQGLVNIWSLAQYEFNLTSQYKTLWKIFLKSIALTNPNTR